MKKACYIIAAVLTAAALLAACQATPDKPAVVQKDMEQMIEKAQAKQTSSADTLAQLLGAPEHVKLDELNNAQGTFTVYTDADVAIPDAADISTIRVTKHAFTQQEAKRIADALFNGQQTYSGDILLSKQYYQDRILKFQSELAAETDEDNRRQLQGSIDKFRGVMNTLPEGEGLVEMSPEFTAQNGAQSIYLVSDGADGRYSTFRVSNDTRLGVYALLYLCGKNGYAEDTVFYNERISAQLRHGREAGGNPESIAAPDITGEQAQYVADALADKLGVGDFECRRNSLVFGLFDGEWIKAYALEYTRQIGGAPITYVDANASGAVDDGQGGYIQGWGYERLSFVVDGSGVLRMELYNPYDLGDTVTEQTTLLPFDNIMDTYKNMIVIINAYTYMTAELNIDNITLGLARITDSSMRETGIVVSAWDFFGRLKVTDERGEASVMDDPAEARLTLNAIDGTVIDRNLGY